MAHTFNPLCNVVLIDDYPDDQLCFQRAADRTGRPFQIRTFFSGPAFAYVAYLKGDQKTRDRATCPRPDVILCDYDLRSVKGSCLVAAIRTIPSCEDLMIVMLSALDTEEIVSACYAAGVNHFLCKPTTQEGFNLLAETLYTCSTSCPVGFDCLNHLAEYRPGLVANV